MQTEIIVHQIVMRMLFMLFLTNPGTWLSWGVKATQHGTVFSVNIVGLQN